MTVRTKQDYLDFLNQLIPDNSTQQISPLDIRTALSDLADSIPSLITDIDLDVNNFGTPEVRNTRAGINALGKLELEGHSSSDSSAFGYYALGGNYNGVRNTAFGSHSLGCNLYGSENVGVGFNANASNLTGSGNVGIGNYTLHLNKTGSFNIAIGHAAGHYIGLNDSYKFYLGAHNQDMDSLCGTQPGSGSPPLLFGDLQGLKLGIGVKTLHNYGALQVSGDASPSNTKVFNLGHGAEMWNAAYIASGLAYSDSGNFTIARLSPVGDQFIQTQLATFTKEGRIGFGDVVPNESGLITVGGSIVPSLDGTYKLGAPTLKWDGYFNDLVVSGHATINNLTYNTIQSCMYDCKTLHLATSGDCSDGLVDSMVCGYLPDEGIDGGGFQIHSSGTTYRRDYMFLYKFPDQNLRYLEQDNAYSRSRWLSNISIAVTGGCHVQTNRVLGTERVALVSQSGGYGLFIRSNQTTPTSNKVWLGSEDHVGYSYSSDINIIGPSGNTNDFILSLSTPVSDVRIGQRTLTRVSGTPVGYGFEYYDTSNPSTDRLSTHIYNGQSNILEATTLLRNVHPVSGLFGITNIQHTSSGAPILPATIFNVQATSRLEARFATISASEKARLQLLGNGNSKASGLQISYNPANDSQGAGIFNRIVVSMDLIRPSGTTGVESGVMSVTERGFLGIGRDIVSADPLTISHVASNSGTIALKQQANSPTLASTFGKLYVKPYTIDETQSQSLYFLDDFGHEFNIVRNQNNSQDSLLYGDQFGNTYGGWYCPIERPTANCSNNTAIGYAALSGINTGNNNVAIGSGALQRLQTGHNNVVVGDGSLQFNVTGGGNIVLGNFNAPATFTNSNCILIGSGLAPTGMSSNSFLVGFDNVPLLQGSFSARTLAVKNGAFSVNGESDYQTFTVSTSVASNLYTTNLDVKDNLTSGTFPSGFMSLRFNTTSTNNVLMNFDHRASGMTRTPTYAAVVPARPSVEVSGDIKLLGAIRFSDGSSAETAGAMTIQGGTGIYVSGGAINLKYDDLDSVYDIVDPVTVDNSLLAMSVFNGFKYEVGKVSLQDLTTFIGSGYASVATNCNHIFTNADNQTLISRTLNANNVFIGCGVAQAATGWKQSVFIGTEAGAFSVTPNVDLLTDTACTFLGYKAGYASVNAQNSIFLGTNAGDRTTGAGLAVFIGANAGQHSRFSSSVGIGENALRGLPSTVVTGTGNIEIIAGGITDTQRLMYNQSTSNKLNIGNSIAGDIKTRRISAGAATLTPDAPFSVLKNSLIPGHSGTTYIQTWYCDGTLVAGLDCQGNLVTSGGTSDIVEGYMHDQVLRPTLGSSPLSGVLLTRDANWNVNGSVYVVVRDVTQSLPAGAYVIAHKVNGTYRPIHVACSGV